MPITAGTRWYLPMNACTILVNTCHPYPIGDVIPRERLRSSGIDGIFKRAPNARIRKVAGVVTGSNGIPLPTVNLMPIAQTAAYLNSSSALLMGHFFLPPPLPHLGQGTLVDRFLSWYNRPLITPLMRSVPTIA